MPGREELIRLRALALAEGSPLAAMFAPGVAEVVYLHRRGQIVVATMAAARRLGADAPGDLVGRELPPAVGAVDLPVVLGGQALTLTIVHEAERQVQRQQRLLQTIIDASPDLIFAKDLAHRFLMVNRSFAARMGVRPEDMLGRADTDFLTEAECQGDPTAGTVGFHHDDRRAFAGELVHNPHDRATLADGVLRVFDTIKGPLHDEDGRVVGVFGYSRDMTERVHAERRLAERKAELAALFDAGPYCVKVLDARGFLVTMNRSGLRMCEAPSIAALRDRPVSQLLAPAYRAAFDAMHQAVLRGESRRIEYEIVGLQGTRRWLESHAVPLPAPDDPTRVDRVLSVTVDISERRWAERALRESEARLKLVFDHTSDLQVLYALARDGRLTLEAFNAAAVAAARRHRPDFDPATLIGEEHGAINAGLGVPPAAIEHFQHHARLAATSRQPRRVIGDVMPGETLDSSFVPVLDDAGSCTHVLWTARDVTEETRARARIAAQLAEKETLLREVHHRVKNNLQIVTSLLSLQQRAAGSPALSAMLEESRRRIAAMSLVHEHLYGSDDLAEVDMAAYARRLSTSLLASFGTLPSRVALRVEGTTFALTMERAIPCGLLLNELITNALKHAFPGERRGHIIIRVGQDDAGATIEVHDDGVGFAPDLATAPRSLGLLLLPRLAAQLGASLERHDAGPGTRYRLRLPRPA